MKGTFLGKRWGLVSYSRFQRWPPLAKRVTAQLVRPIWLAAVFEGSLRVCLARFPKGGGIWEGLMKSRSVQRAFRAQDILGLAGLWDVFASLLVHEGFG